MQSPSPWAALGQLTRRLHPAAAPAKRPTRHPGSKRGYVHTGGAPFRVRGNTGRQVTSVARSYRNGRMGALVFKTDRKSGGR
jgi:hypothetical protein